MAIKKYYVTQYVVLNGDKKVSSFAFTGEEADLQKLLDSLEGGFEVKEVNATLSNMANADNNVTAWNDVGYIKFSGKTDDGHYVGATVRPFRGHIVLKSTVSSEDLRVNLQNAQVFAIAPTVKATSVGVYGIGGSVASSD